MPGSPSIRRNSVNHSLELWNTEPLNEGINKKEPMCAQPNLWGTRSGLIILEHSPNLCSFILTAPKSTSHVSLSVTSLWLCMWLPSQSPCRPRQDSREKAPRKHCSRHPVPQLGRLSTAQCLQTSPFMESFRMGPLEIETLPGEAKSQKKRCL